MKTLQDPEAAETVQTTEVPAVALAATYSGLGRHLSNIGDHRELHAEMMHCYSYHAHFDPAGRRHEWESHLRWINGNVIGPPKETDHYTQAQLEEMGMIGIYAPIDGQNANVDLPDTAAQDSASKSNSPAVSG